MTIPNKLRDDAAKMIAEAAILERVGSHPVFAAFPARTAFTTTGRKWTTVTLCAEVASRAEAAALFESVAARLAPLPVVAARHTFATVCPADDFDGPPESIVLDSESALPLAYDVEGFRANENGNHETLRAWFQTESDRVAIRVQVKPAPAFCRGIRAKVNDFQKGVRKGDLLAWQWRGLPNSSATFRYTSADSRVPGGFTFAFDVSTDLAAWLDGDNAEQRQPSR